MCSSEESYRIEAALAEPLAVLTPGQRRGLALWVWGTVLARRACESAVLAAVLVVGRVSGLRQRLRDWLRDGADKATPCQSQVDVAACFAQLLARVVRWWQPPADGAGLPRLPLAIDATTLGDRLTVLAVSVLYRGCAIPVAWHMLPGNVAGE